MVELAVWRRRPWLAAVDVPQLGAREPDAVTHPRPARARARPPQIYDYIDRHITKLDKDCKAFDAGALVLPPAGVGLGRRLLACWGQGCASPESQQLLRHCRVSCKLSAAC